MKPLIWSVFAAALSTGCMTGAGAPGNGAQAIAEPNGCLPAGYDLAAMTRLKESAWVIPDDDRRRMFALAITSCLDSPDPHLRDGLAFDALAGLMRSGSLDPGTLQQLNERLQARLVAPDPEGYGRPFAVLALAEVARTDRIEPWLSGTDRAHLIVAGQHYLINISDYRGFDDVEGWRHGVAHASDLMMQLVLNPRVDREGLELIRSAIGVQAAPSEHAYIHGESARLARPILFMARRGVFTEAEWTDWLAGVAGIHEKDRREDDFSSSAGLARRHNTLAFLQALHTGVTLDESAADDVLLPGLEAALLALS